MSGPNLPKPGVKPGQPARPSAPSAPLEVQRGIIKSGERIVIYGAGAIGKTTLADLIRKIGIDILFFDLASETQFLDTARIQVSCWDELIAGLYSPTVNEFGAVCIDALTNAEEFAGTWTIAHVPHPEKENKKISRIEDYGFGKGYSMVYETFLQLLQACDAIARTGRHVICTAHECQHNVTNLWGDDYFQFQPRLQCPPSGKGSIRHRVKEWTQHMFYIGYDISVNDRGKAQGHGSRTIYTSERPTHWAKSRTLSNIEPFPYRQGEPDLWRKLLTPEGNHA